MRFLTAKLDFVYITPALLCNFAFLCGLIPALFCLDGIPFAYLSVGIFLVSIVFHFYILLQWRRYQNVSPLGYAIVQPVLHFMMLVFALVVGGTNICMPQQPMYDPQELNNEKILPAEDPLWEVISDS